MFFWRENCRILAHGAPTSDVNHIEPHPTPTPLPSHHCLRYCESMKAKGAKLKEEERRANPIHVVSRTPRLVCSLILSPAQSNGSSDSVHDANASASSLEAAFIHQNVLKGRQHGSFASMISNNSGRSLATSATNVSHSGRSLATSATNMSSSTTEQSKSLQRVGSMSSVASISSLTTAQQYHSQSVNNSSSTYRPTASLALPSNPQTGTPMKIAFEEYLMVPTRDGRVLMYQIQDFFHAEACAQEDELNRYALNKNESYHKSIANNRKMASSIQKEKEAVQPVFSLGPFYVGDYLRSSRNSTDKLPSTPASIVDICICEADKTKKNPSATLGNVAILTQEGDVHVYEFFSLQSGGAGPEGDTNQLKVDHMHSFHSGDISATSLAMQRSLKRTTVVVNNTTLRTHQAELRIAVGHEGGVISEYTIIERRHLIKWKGKVEYPIRSLAYIYTPSVGDEADKMIPRKDAKTMQPLDEQLFLVIGIAQTGMEGTRPSTTEEILSSCLEVISTADVEKEWNSKHRGSRISTAIELDQFSIWPTNHVKGKGGVVSSAMQSTGRHGTNAVCIIGR